MTRAKLLQQKIVNPNTQNKVSVRYALRLPKQHPAYKAAVALIASHSKKKKVVSKKPKKKKNDEPRSLGVKQRFVDIVKDRVEEFAEEGDLEALEAHGRKHFNGVSPLEIAAKYLEMIYDPTKDEISEIEVKVDYRRFPQININIVLKNGTTITRMIKTSTRTGKNVIKNDFFELGGGESGKGFAKKMLEGTLEIADSIGAEAVLFEAGLSAGGYVWAKYGGIPAPTSRIGQYALIYPRLRNFDKVIRRRIDDTKDHLESLKKSTTDSSYRAQQIKRQTKNLEMLEEAERFIQENPQFLKTLTKLFKKEIDKLGSWYNHEKGYHNVPLKLFGKLGKELSPDLLSYLAQTPLGKMFLLESGWNGYFNMRKSSIGRKMLELALNDRTK